MRWLAALALAACAGRAPATLRGTPAPELAAIDLAGHPVRLAAYRGHPVVLDFWDSTCEPCLRALPALAALADRVAIVSITSEPPSAALRAFVTAHAMRWVVASDRADATADAFHIAAYPTYVLVDPAGTIVCARCTLGAIEGQLAPDQRYSRRDGQR